MLSCCDSASIGLAGANELARGRVLLSIGLTGAKELARGRCWLGLLAGNGLLTSFSVPIF